MYCYSCDEKLANSLLSAVEFVIDPLGKKIKEKKFSYQTCLILSWLHYVINYQES